MVWKRKKYIVNVFQYRLIAYHVLYLCVALAAMYGAGVLELVGQVGDPSLSAMERR